MPIVEPRRDVLAAIAASVGGVLVFLAVSYAIRLATAHFGFSGDVAATVSSAVLIPVCLLVRQRLLAAGLRSDDGRGAADPRVVALALILGVCLAAASFPFRGSDTVATFGVWAVLGYGVAAPIAEELLFRGCVLEGLEPILGRAGALAFSSVLFAVGHVDPAHIAFALAAGFAFGLVFQAGRSIAVAIVAHAVANLISLALAWVLPNAASSAFALISLVALVLGIAILARRAYP